MQILVAITHVVIDDITPPKKSRGVVLSEAEVELLSEVLVNYCEIGKSWFFDMVRNSTQKFLLRINKKNSKKHLSLFKRPTVKNKMQINAKCLLRK